MPPDSSIHWKAYPALLLAGCLAVGISAAARLGGSFWEWVGGVALGLATVLLSLLWPRRRLVTLRPLAWTLGTALATVGAGGALLAAYETLPEEHIAHNVAALPSELAPPRVTLEGRVADAPSDLSRGLRFTLAAQRAMTAQDTLAVTGSVQVRLSESPWASDSIAFRERLSLPAQGDLVRAAGQLAPVPSKRNPADFDYGAYLKRRGIYAVLSTFDPESLSVLDRAGWNPLAAARHHVEEQLSQHVQSEASQAVLRALLLGDRSRVTDATRDRFARTGLMHLLAVSGLHVLLVGMTLYMLLRPTLVRLGLRWTTIEVSRALLTMSLLGFYMLLTGARPSVVRAVVMAGVFIGSVVLRRSAHALNTLGVAAVVLLVFRPAQLFDAGFQLSFAAVAAIVTLNPLVERALPPSWTARGNVRWLVTSFSTSFAAVVGTLPVLLYHFGYVSFAGILLNVVAIPCTALALAAALLMVVTGLWSGCVATCFGAAADVCTRLLLWTAQAGDATLHWAALHLPVRSPWALLALMSVLVMAAQWPRPRLRWRLSTAALSFVMIGLWSGVISGAHAPRLDIVFFDVGQGDAVLVGLPNGQHVLVDTGLRTPFGSEAEHTILPHLERYGVRRLDAVIISHSDGDHLGGLPALLRSVPVGRVIHSGDSASTALYAESMHLLDSLDIPHKAVRAGDTLRLAPSVDARVLAPMQSAGVTDNNASLVLRLAYGKTHALFLGDAEAETEEQMLTRFGPLLTADVVKVGHHGSATSSTLALVRRIAADSSSTSHAVVSVGRRNNFGMPSRAVVQRWRSQGAVVLTTAREGAVWLRSNGERFERVWWK